MVEYTCSYSTSELKEGEPEIQGHVPLHGEFKTSIGYIKHTFKK